MDSGMGWFATPQAAGVSSGGLSEEGCVEGFCEEADFVLSESEG
jgi:hypothetical protein